MEIGTSAYYQPPFTEIVCPIM